MKKFKPTFNSPFAQFIVTAALQDFLKKSENSDLDSIVPPPVLIEEIKQCIDDVRRPIDQKSVLRENPSQPKGKKND